MCAGQQTRHFVDQGSLGPLRRWVAGLPQRRRTPRSIVHHHSPPNQIQRFDEVHRQVRMTRTVVLQVRSEVAIGQPSHHRGLTHLSKHTRDVDPLATGHDGHALHSIDPLGHQPVHHIGGVERRVAGDREDHDYRSRIVTVRPAGTLTHADREPPHA